MTAPVTPPRPRRTTRGIALAVGAVCAALVIVLATRPSAQSVKASSPLIGKPAPEISGPALSGDSFRLSTLRGRFVVVNFFATWCVPCREEHPELVRFQQRHADTGDAAVVSVVFDDTRARVSRFFRDNGGDWPVVDDGGAQVRYGVRGVPESYLVGPDGYVLARITGGVKAADLERLLAQARQPR